MTLTIYHLKTCDTCRKAIKSIKASGAETVLIDVRADGVPESDLKHLMTSAGWEKLLNTRSTTWRGLSDADKADMNQPKALKLITEHPTLMKRPVIDTGTQVHVGWSKDVQALFA